MERLVELRDSIGGFEASFFDSSINIAAGVFTYDAFKPNVNVNQIRTLIHYRR